MEIGRGDAERCLSDRRLMRILAFFLLDVAVS